MSVKSDDALIIAAGYRRVIEILALIGTIFIIFSTNRYGAGLSNDSVEYIGIARNLMEDAGFIHFDGSPLVVWPPLYPVILATIGGIFGQDPLLFADILNAIIFGLIIYMGGVLTFRHLPSHPSLALVGTLAILVSNTLFSVSVMAWTEPLFIFLVILCLVFADSYLSKNDKTSLILLALMVALSSLTRYMGAAMIFWGASIIIVFHRGNIKSKMAHLSLFICIAVFPVMIWLIHNYAVSGTFFGPRASSGYTLFQNLMYVSVVLWKWYIPVGIDPFYILIAVGFAVYFLLYFGFKVWQRRDARLRRVGPLVLFVVIYTAFLVITSTTTAYDPIGYRLLSPIYVPVTLLLLICIQFVFHSFRRYVSPKIINVSLVISFSIWLLYPTYYTILNAKNMISFGRGFSGNALKNSKIIQYLRQRTLDSRCMVYSNSPEIAYILANLVTKKSPAKRKFNSPDKLHDISDLKGSWPEEDNACLIWFYRIGRLYLFTLSELREIADMELIARFDDGAIYSVKRK